ncbi:GerAB/ArcD/ProY family transporter [Thermoactinomyces sp. DSM 45892]|uniref:GerAB/ArcD/ProY family transporter n=1 Tax=Thermoactinomyces sp. DSM 45892 TaxID=1882753 RepID=UPI0008942775|nr:GerAB/ArcD/ProY family transporter [Thermoactinomyces sp. DSM 45892]SDX99172.1 spore germination protein (amino acid permease) [Thermoactinomyces sp. DSM 45892]
MNYSIKDKITSTQFLFFILQTQLGVGILSLAHQIHKDAKGGAWISVIMGGVISQVMIVIFWAFLKKNPASNFLQAMEKLVGKITAKGLVIGYSCFFALVTVLELSEYIRIITKWVFPETPVWINILIVAIAVVYLAKESLGTITRMYVFVSFLIIPLVIFTSLGFKNVHFTYPMPFLENGWLAILKGAKMSFFYFLGYEAMLFTYFAVEGSDKDKLKAASIGNFFVTIVYTFTTFVCLISFAPDELPLVPEPVLYVLKSYSLHVIERIDLIFLSIWLVSVITSVCSFVYLSSIGVAQICRAKNHKKFVYWIAAVCCVCTIFTLTPHRGEIFDEFIKIISYPFVFGIPILLFIISLFRGRKR